MKKIKRMLVLCTCTVLLCACGKSSTEDSFKNETEAPEITATVAQEPTATPIPQPTTSRRPEERL